MICPPPDSVSAGRNGTGSRYDLYNVTIPPTAPIESKGIGLVLSGSNTPGTSDRAGYLTWNDAVASHFLRPTRSGTPVYLFVTGEVIREAGRSFGEGVDEFVAAVRAGPPAVTRSGHCQRALQVADDWREHGFVYPPYIAYLALFVLAGGHEGDFAPNAYYPRLWELLGEAGVGRPPSFDRMFELWDDLERWSVQDRHGDLGVFEARTVGGWVHVGLPLAQTVLTEAERRSLPNIFADAGLEAGTPPSNRHLKRALTVFGRSYLRPRTISALNHGSGSFVDAVLDVSADDFQAWNGETTLGPMSSPSAQRVTAGLRLCLAVDRVAGRIHTRLRCRSARELPDQGLILSSASSTLACTAFTAGWSSALTDLATEQDFEPPKSTWLAGLVAIGTSADWSLKLSPARVRAFIEGSAEGLPGLVEVVEVPRDRPFYVAFSQSAAHALEPWLETECDGWRRIDINHGLPTDWVFGSVARAESDRGLSQVEPRLAFADRLTLRLLGGVRATAGNSYLAVAPPRVAVDGAVRGDTLYCDGQPLVADDPSAQIYHLPTGLPLDSRIGIEVRRGETVLRRNSVYLMSGFSWRLSIPVGSVDRYGRIVDDGTGVAGAIVPWESTRGFVFDLFRTPGLSVQATRIYFVGRRPGEVACWPRDSLPTWTAIWAIPFGARSGRALFCGDSVEESEPVSQRYSRGRRRKLWKSVLWRHRRHITGPQDPQLKQLWRRYREAARGL